MAGHTSDFAIALMQPCLDPRPRGREIINKSATGGDPLIDSSIFVAARPCKKKSGSNCVRSAVSSSINLARPSASPGKAIQFAAKVNVTLYRRGVLRGGLVESPRATTTSLCAKNCS